MSINTTLLRFALAHTKDRSLAGYVASQLPPSQLCDPQVKFEPTWVLAAQNRGVDFAAYAVKHCDDPMTLEAVFAKKSNRRGAVVVALIENPATPPSLIEEVKKQCTSIYTVHKALNRYDIQQREKKRVQEWVDMDTEERFARICIAIDRPNYRTEPLEMQLLNYDREVAFTKDQLRRLLEPSVALDAKTVEKMVVSLWTAYLDPGGHPDAHALWQRAEVDLVDVFTALSADMQTPVACAIFDYLSLSRRDATSPLLDSRKTAALVAALPSSTQAGMRKFDKLVRMLSTQRTLRWFSLDALPVAVEHPDLVSLVFAHEMPTATLLGLLEIVSPPRAHLAGLRLDSREKVKIVAHDYLTKADQPGRHKPAWYLQDVLRHFDGPFDPELPTVLAASTDEDVSLLISGSLCAFSGEKLSDRPFLVPYHVAAPLYERLETVEPFSKDRGQKASLIRRVDSLVEQAENQVSAWEFLEPYLMNNPGMLTIAIECESFAQKYIYEKLVDSPAPVEMLLSQLSARPATTLGQLLEIANAVSA